MSGSATVCLCMCIHGCCVCTCTNHVSKNTALHFECVGLLNHQWLSASQQKMVFHLAVATACLQARRNIGQHSTALPSREAQGGACFRVDVHRTAAAKRLGSSAAGGANTCTAAGPGALASHASVLEVWSLGGWGMAFETGTEVAWIQRAGMYDSVSMLHRQLWW